MATPINRDTLASWMRAGAAFDLVDTLPATAYARHHLPGAIHIVSDDIEAEAPRRLPDHDRTVAVYCGSTACQRSAKAAAGEIAGCFAFWAWLRLDRSPWWALIGVVAVVAFAWFLTRVDTAFAARAYAAYGGVYIASSLAWLWAVEGHRPDRWDALGAAICLLAPRAPA